MGRTSGGQGNQRGLAWLGGGERRRRRGTGRAGRRSCGAHEAARVPGTERGWGLRGGRTKFAGCRWARKRSSSPPPGLLRKLVTWNRVLWPLASVLFAFRTGSVRDISELCTNWELRAACWPRWVLDLYQAEAERRAKFCSPNAEE